jgi:tetratricopeptide (TPR) repeat protein
MQRARIEERVTHALERLATQATDVGDIRRAVTWWKRAAALRPLDSSVAVQLIRALAAAGDRSGALQHATVHSTLLRNELDLEPDAAVVDLARSLREPSPPAVPRTDDRRGDAIGEATPAFVAQKMDIVAPNANSDGDGDGDGDEAPVANFAAPFSAVHQSVDSSGHRRRSMRRWQRASVLLTAAMVLVATGIAIGRSRHVTTDLPPRLKQRVVVAPFRVAGAVAALGYLRDGMVELLSTRLADDSSARSVDAGAVLGAWRSAGLAPAMDVPRDTVVRVAARLGAERVVVGGVVGTPGRLVMRATVLRVPSGAVASQATVEGSADSITALVDRLAARLLVAEAGEEDRLGNHLTASLPALRAFLLGQAAFRRNDYAAAVRQYEASLLRDSTFALAALRLAIAADRTNDAARVRRAIGTAWSFRRELAERDDAILMAFTGTRFPAPPLARDQVSQWQRAAELAPASAEAWLSLGARLYHDGAVAGVPISAERAATAVRRALVADSTYAPAAHLAVQLEIQTAGAIRISATTRRLALDDSSSPLAPFLRWRTAIAHSDSSALRLIRAEFTRLGPTNLRAIALASQFDAIGLADGRSALVALRSRTSGHVLPIDLLLGEHALALNEGRVRDALGTTTGLQTSLPDSHAHLRLRVLDRLYGDGDTLAARASASDLEESVSPLGRDARGESSRQAADLCVLAQWQLATGNIAKAITTTNALRARTPIFSAPSISATPAACVELLDAGIAVASNRRDARARLSRLDSLAFTTAIAGDAATYAPLWISQLYEHVGDVRCALRAIRRREYMTDWPRYAASMWRAEGRLAEDIGDIAGARDAYRRFLALRHSPDAALGAQVDSVRRAADRLTSRDTPR